MQLCCLSVTSPALPGNLDLCLMFGCCLALPGTLDALRRIWAEEGAGGFFKGLGAKVVQVGGWVGGVGQAGRSCSQPVSVQHTTLMTS